MSADSSHQRIQTVCLLVLTAIALGAALHGLAAVMVPFVLAVFLAVVITPVVQFLGRRLRVPAAVGLVVALVLGAGVIGLLGLLVSQSVGQLQQNSAQYEAGIGELRGRAEGWMRKLGIETPLVAPATGEEGPAGAPRPPTAAERLVRELLPSTINTLLGLLSQGFLVLIFMLFLVTGRVHAGTLGDVEQHIKSYLTTKVIVSAITGILTWAALAILQVPMALVFGLFAFLLNFVPNIGSVIATLLPLPLLLIGDFTTTVVILGLAIPGAVQFVVGNVLEPRMLSGKMDLHPVTVLLALMFWGFIWGVVGALLATPMTAVVRLLLEKMELTRPVAALMAGRWPEAGALGAPGAPGGD